MYNQTEQHLPWARQYLNSAYLVAAVMFVIGLKLLSHPETARRGNLWAASRNGACNDNHSLSSQRSIRNLNTIKQCHTGNLAIIFASVIGWMIARRVKMTAMPQLVSLFNATGGAASALVALLEFPNVASIRSSCSNTSWPLYRKCGLQWKYDCLRKT